MVRDHLPSRDHRSPFVSTPRDFRSLVVESTPFLGSDFTDVPHPHTSPSLPPIDHPLNLNLRLLRPFSLAVSFNTLYLHRLQIAIITALVASFAINGVQYIYPGQQRSDLGLKGGSALKGVGAGWLILAIVDVSDKMKMLLSPWREGLDSTRLHCDRGS